MTCVLNIQIKLFLRNKVREKDWKQNNAKQEKIIRLLKHEPSGSIKKEFIESYVLSLQTTLIMHNMNEMKIAVNK